MTYENIKIEETHELSYEIPKKMKKTHELSCENSQNRKIIKSLKSIEKK